MDAYGYGDGDSERDGDEDMNTEAQDTSNMSWASGYFKTHLDDDTGHNKAHTMNGREVGYRDEDTGPKRCEERIIGP